MLCGALLALALAWCDSKDGRAEECSVESVLRVLHRAGTTGATDDAQAEESQTSAAAAAAQAAPEPAEQLGTTSNGRMQLLWQWKCDLTAGRNVSCMAWNHERIDLVAVGYGSFDFGQHGDGMVCIWSMKNPCYPLWWLRVATGVTCMDFSRASGAQQACQQLLGMLCTCHHTKVISIGAVLLLLHEHAAVVCGCYGFSHA